MQVSVSIPDAYRQDPERFGARAETIFITELMKLWQAYLLPAFRQTTPRRTGQLRRSLVVVREDNRLSIRVRPQGFYWFMQRGLPLRYRTIFNQMLPRLVTMALIRTQERLGLDTIDIA